MRRDVRLRGRWSRAKQRRERARRKRAEAIWRIAQEERRGRGRPDPYRQLRR